MISMSWGWYQVILTMNTCSYWTPSTMLQDSLIFSAWQLVKVSTVFEYTRMGRIGHKANCSMTFEALFIPGKGTRSLGVFMEYLPLMAFVNPWCLANGKTNCITVECSNCLATQPPCVLAKPLSSLFGGRGREGALYTPIPPPCFLCCWMQMMWKVFNQSEGMF